MEISLLLNEHDDDVVDEDNDYNDKFEKKAEQLLYSFQDHNDLDTSILHLIYSTINETSEMLLQLDHSAFILKQIRQDFNRILPILKFRRPDSEFDEPSDAYTLITNYLKEKGRTMLITEFLYSKFNPGFRIDKHLELIYSILQNIDRDFIPKSKLSSDLLYYD